MKYLFYFILYPKQTSQSIISDLYLKSGCEYNIPISWDVQAKNPHFLGFPHHLKVYFFEYLCMLKN